MQMSTVRLAVVSLVGLVSSCSSPSSSGPTPVPSDPTSEQVAFSYVTNLIPAQITVGGTSATAYVDTGNPFVLLDPSTFTSISGLAALGGDIPSVVVGSTTAENVYVIPTTDGLTSPDPAFPLHANLGCTAICKFVATFNYRDVAFGLAPAAPAPPAGLEPEIVLAFSFEGGSEVGGVNVPKSRIVVPVTIEGTKYTMMLDTGASYVTVTQAAFTAITQDGRPTANGGTAETTEGTSTTTVARVSSVVVGGTGGAEVQSVVIAHDTSFDMNLEEVSTDTGQQIDGSLGGTFLHDFYVTVDYATAKVHFARYSDTSFAIDPAEQIGIALAQQGSNYVVAAADQAAAALGVTSGDVVTSIDGQLITGLPVAQASVLLFGKVGSTKMVAFGAAAHLGYQSVSLTVEELLPQ